MSFFKISSHVVLSLLLTLPFLILSGCAAGGQGTGPSFGQVLGQAMGEVLSESLSEGTDRAMGKYKGEIRSIRVLRQDDYGYLLEVNYSDVRFPEGTALIAEAYSPTALLTEYVSTPTPVTARSGAARMQLTFQGSTWSTSHSKPTRIMVKLYRDNNPGNYFAASSYDLVSRNTTPMAGAASSGNAAAAPSGQTPPSQIVPVPAGPANVTPPSQAVVTGPMKTVTMAPVATAKVTGTSNLQMISPQLMQMAAMAPVVSYTLGSKPYCTSQGKKENFTTLEQGVFLRVQLANLKAGSVCRYDWIDPQGGHHPKEYNLSGSSSICHADMLAIQNGLGSKRTGQWTVKFYHNNQLKITQTFTISLPAIKSVPWNMLGR